MKNILDLNEKEAREFFLKQESYVKFDLPLYFSFQELIDKLNKKLTDKNLSDFRDSSPREFDDVNYKLITNKDGKYAWRPFSLINPVIYVSLVHKITEKQNWESIQEKFKTFQINKKIECHSLPMVADKDDENDKKSQIYTWWQKIEQKSISLALDYKYALETDISDCYGSIYTHSISWAIHTKEIAKKNRKNSLLGNAIDNHLQDMRYGQTNGIPQGSVLMDFIAEIILGFVDLELTEKLSILKITNYKILRYRDDYRIFTNNPFESEQITKLLSEILSEFGLKLNTDKTKATDNIIKSSIKPDKRYWIINKRVAGSKQKWLVQLFLLSEQYPNSGTLDTQMREFLNVLKKSKKKDSNIESLISLTSEIAFRNPRVYPSAVAILSLLINQIDEKDSKKEIVNRIRKKFLQIPNSSLLKIWLQRLYMKIDETIEYDEPLCKKVIDENEKIWNCDWLNKSIKDIVDKTSIIENKKVEKLKEVISNKEIKLIVSSKAY